MKDELLLLGNLRQMGKMKYEIPHFPVIMRLRGGFIEKIQAKLWNLLFGKVWRMEVIEWKA